ncbi:MAG: PAS domain-containing protein [Phycisphaerae bacterium]
MVERSSKSTVLGGCVRPVLAAVVLAIVGLGLLVYADATQRRSVVSRAHADHLGHARNIGAQLVTDHRGVFLPEELIREVHHCPIPGSRVCLSMNGGSAMVCRQEGPNGVATSQINFSQVVAANQGSDYIGSYMSRRGQRRLLSLAWLPSLDMFVGLDVAERDVVAATDRLGAWPAVVGVVTSVGILLIFVGATRPVPKPMVDSGSPASLHEALVSSVPSGDVWSIFLLDRDGVILDANSLAAAWVDQTPLSIRGRSFGELFPDEAELYAADAHLVFTSGEPKQRSVEPLGRLGQDLRWVCVDKYRWSDDEGRVKGMLVMAQDITKERRAAEHAALETAMA